MPVTGWYRRYLRFKWAHPLSVLSAETVLVAALTAELWTMVGAGTGRIMACIFGAASLTDFIELWLVRRAARRQEETELAPVTDIEVARSSRRSS